MLVLQVTGSSDVAVQLMYMHPGTNGELDFLFGPGGDRKRYKRRRGERGAPGKQLAAVGELVHHLCGRVLMFQLLAAAGRATSSAAAVRVALQASRLLLHLSA